MLFLFHHASRLEENEILELLGDIKLGHNWARMADVVCDGHAKGLSVAFDEDSMLGAQAPGWENRKHGMLSYVPFPKVHLRIDGNNAKALLYAFKAVKTALLENEQFKEIVGDAQEEFFGLTEKDWQEVSQEELKGMVGKIWEPQSIFSKAFQENAAKKGFELS